MSDRWPSHRLQDLLGIELPLIQAPMAGAQLSSMTIAVCESGGLGSLPCAMLSAEQMRHELETICAATSRPFNVNFFCHRPPAEDQARGERWRAKLEPYYRELAIDPSTAAGGASRKPFDDTMCTIVEELKPAVVSFHFGLPDDGLLARVRATGAKILSSATTVDEARWLEDKGCDAIIAQGFEAGGHRGLFLTDDLSTQLGTMSLVPLLVDAVRVPVIASGGIMDARGIVAALAMGAAGVQLGTAYLRCQESTISAPHREALRRGNGYTAVTNVISGRPARGIVNRLIREVGPLSPDAPAFPLATAGVAPLRAAAEKRGSGDFSPLWAGQAFPLGRELPAGELTRTLAHETLAHLMAVDIGGRAQEPSATPIREHIAASGMTAVGMTARWIAASRAIESERSDGLFHDPFARDLAGDAGFAMRRAMTMGMQAGNDRDALLAIRTRFFDDTLMEWAAADAPAQVLILAAGMDSRAFRLAWPSGTVVYEVDRTEILDYKEPILDRLGATPRSNRRIVRADLATDWAPALLEAGFDPHRVTAVLAEGLTMYLTEQDVRQLMETLRTLVPAGSRLGMDVVNADMLTSPYTTGLVKLLDTMGCPWRFGFEAPEAFLRDYGWSSTLIAPGDPEANYGIWPFPPVPRAIPNMPRSWFTRGTLLSD